MRINITPYYMPNSAAKNYTNNTNLISNSTQKTLNNTVSKNYANTVLNFGTRLEDNFVRDTSSIIRERLPIVAATSHKMQTKANEVRVRLPEILRGINDIECDANDVLTDSRFAHREAIDDILRSNKVSDLSKLEPRYKHHIFSKPTEDPYVFSQKTGLAKEVRYYPAQKRLVVKERQTEQKEKTYEFISGKLSFYEERYVGYPCPIKTMEFTDDFVMASHFQIIDDNGDIRNDAIYYIPTENGEQIVYCEDVKQNRDFENVRRAYVISDKHMYAYYEGARIPFNNYPHLENGQTYYQYDKYGLNLQKGERVKRFPERDRIVREVYDYDNYSLSKQTTITSSRNYPTVKTATYTFVQGNEDAAHEIFKDPYISYQETEGVRGRTPKVIARYNLGKLN